MPIKEDAAAFKPPEGPRERKERFDEENIEIPFPHMTLAAGKALGPIPVRMVPEVDES